MSSAYADQATDTSDFVTLDTNQTITGTKTISAPLILQGANQLRLGSSTGPYFEYAAFGTFTGYNFFFENGRLFELVSGNERGTADVFFQSAPGAAGWSIFRGVGGLGLEFSTSNDTPVQIMPNAVLAADFTDNGTLIATGGTGGTRISKLKFGTATMATGTTGSIADTSVTAGSTILVTPGFLPLGTLYYQIVAATGFTILSTNAADAGSVSYQRLIP